jgi:hypothetical protein
MFNVVVSLVISLSAQAEEPDYQVVWHRVCKMNFTFLRTGGKNLGYLVAWC